MTITGIHLQALRYAIVGGVSNLLLYALYIAFTTLGLKPISAMTFAYSIGVAQAYLVHRRWTFSHRGRFRDSSLRYLLAHLLGYLLNLSILSIFVDIAKIPHQTVQAGAIPSVAVLLFLLQRHWVFRNPALEAVANPDTPDTLP